jgi:hypothetical protein
VHEPNVLVPDDLDLIDESETTEIVSQLLLRQVVVKTSYINVPARIALTDSEPDLGRDRGRFAPADFELLTVQRQFLNGGIGMEGSGSTSVQEGQENAGFLRKDPDGFQRAEMHQVKKFIDGCGGGQVANIDSPACSIRRSTERC